jgi:hypothetical protein
VIARLVWRDGEECRAALANRWTRTHVLVTWIRRRTLRPRNLAPPTTSLASFAYASRTYDGVDRAIADNVLTGSDQQAR